MNINYVEVWTFLVMTCVSLMWSNIFTKLLSKAWQKILSSFAASLQPTLAGINLYISIIQVSIELYYQFVTVTISINGSWWLSEQCVPTELKWELKLDAYLQRAQLTLLKINQKSWLMPKQLPFIIKFHLWKPWGTKFQSMFHKFSAFHSNYTQTRRRRN